ncbi:UDP-N-acetylmuramoyl-L-alanine--D-glutamate ligase [Patescibacteria group bacterium]|nr:UDP-N-acetylmuramoyl-L-alanine--D-glutamate ligase [Patescibacteria group bacterium]MBU1705559.1 UDP-N-acetylmuramoyl-L-alanine--D-glutamate ligase [Patescibacteria group bacterium]
MDLSKIKNFQDSIVTVMGLGRFKQGSGVGAAKWLIKHGAQTVITDMKSEADLKESVEEVMKHYSQIKAEVTDRDIYPPVFVLGEHHEDDFMEADLVLKNPGVPFNSDYVIEAEKNKIPVESDVSLFFRYCPWPIYSVTGTRGKSTTTAWFGHLLKAVHEKPVIAGNIQHSPLEDLDWILLEKQPVPVVLELSSWLLESLKNVNIAPKIAIYTNAFEDHLDRYDSFAGYIAAKEMMFKDQGPADMAILNADNEIVAQAASRIKAKIYWFSLKPLAGREGIWVEDKDIVIQVEGKKQTVCAVDEVGLKGEHNLHNGLAAALGAYLAGVPVDRIAEGLKTFAGLPSRQETVREVKGVTYINDTTATSPEGVIAALERFGQDGKVIWIGGGSSKGLKFEEMAKHLHAACKYLILLEGTALAELSKVLGDAVPKVSVDSMEKAVQAASSVAEAGDIVLLSPGTSSFGMFKNEFDRGGQFVEQVKNLKE